MASNHRPFAPRDSNRALFANQRLKTMAIHPSKLTPWRALATSSHRQRFAPTAAWTRARRPCHSPG
eukprot:1894868-Prymnesium_polylepis.1